jgi:hypothetical protein
MGRLLSDYYCAGWYFKPRWWRAGKEVDGKIKIDIVQGGISNRAGGEWVRR